MKRLLLFLPLILGFIIPSTAQVLQGNTLRIRDSLWLRDKWIRDISIDQQLSGNSDQILATQKAVKAYVDSKIGLTAIADTVNTINRLMAYTGNAGVIFLMDNERAGSAPLFKYIPANIPVDSGIVFPATGKGSGRWVRQCSINTIEAAWFGVLPNGQDVSRQMNKILETYSPVTNTTDTIGVSIKLPRGIIRLKSIIIGRGVKIWADQEAVNNVDAYVQSKVMPAPGADYVFDFSEIAFNSGLVNIYLDGDFTNNPNLIAGIRFRGAFNYLRNNNIIRCPNYAVWSSCGSFRVTNNNFQGQAAPSIPFSSYQDYHGALHITAAGDSYLRDNEIGAYAPYLTGQVSNPINIIRDYPLRRIVSLFAGYLGNSYVSGNLFENGDQGAVINGGIYGNYRDNRYEMNGGGGLHLRNGMYYTTFTDEKFANNSLAVNGGFSDLVLDTGAVAFCTFAHPVFLKMPHPAIPTSNFKVKYNIVNYTGPKGNTLITPRFADRSAEVSKYDSLGNFDTTVQAAKFNWVEGHEDPTNPIFDGAIFGYTGKGDGTVKGSVRIAPGSTTALGGRTGTISFWEPLAVAPTSQIGFNNDGNLDFSLFGTNKQYIFGNGSMILAKPGPNSISLQSNDAGGNTTSINFNSSPTFTKTAGISLTTDGSLNTIATDNMTWATANQGIFTFQNSSMTIAKAGGATVNVIGDGTGNNSFRLSSDGMAAHSMEFGQNNATGMAYIRSGDSIDIGISHNFKLAPNGLTFIPQAPNPATPGRYMILARDTTNNGEMTIVNPLNIPSNTKADNGLSLRHDTVVLGGKPLLDSTVLKTNGFWFSVRKDVSTDTAMFNLGLTRFAGLVFSGNDLSFKDVSSSTETAVQQYNIGAGAGTTIQAGAAAAANPVTKLVVDPLRLAMGTAGAGGSYINVSPSDNASEFKNALVLQGGTRASTGTYAQLAHWQPVLSSNPDSYIRLSDSTVNIATDGQSPGAMINLTSPHIYAVTDSMNIAANYLDIGYPSGFAGRAKFHPLLSEFGLYSGYTTPFSYLQFITDGSTYVHNTMYDAFSKGIVYASDYSANGLTDDNWLTSLKAVKKIVHDSLVTAGGVNIFNSDGTLTSNRTLDGATNSYGLSLTNLNYFGVSGTGSISMSNSATGAGFGMDGFGGVTINGGTAGGVGPGVNITTGDNSNITLTNNYTAGQRIKINGMPNNVAEDSVLTTDNTGIVKMKSLTSLNLDKVLENGNLTTRVANVGGLGVSGPAYFSGGIYLSQRAQNTTGNLNVGDEVVTVNNSGAVTLTLPTAASCDKMVVWVKKQSAASNDVTVKGSGSELIDGANTKVLTIQYSSICLRSNGTKWEIIEGHVGNATY